MQMEVRTSPTEEQRSRMMIMIFGLASSRNISCGILKLTGPSVFPRVGFQDHKVLTTAQLEQPTHMAAPLLKSTWMHALMPVLTSKALMQRWQQVNGSSRFLPREQKEQGMRYG